jgi:hypothetical protein
MLGELISRCALITLMYQTHAPPSTPATSTPPSSRRWPPAMKSRAVHLMDEHLQHVEASLAFDRKCPATTFDGPSS